jgi:predicted hydrocarbon binding protein
MSDPMFDLLVSKDLSGMSEEELDSTFIVHEDGVKKFLGRIPLGCIYATFLAGLYIEMEKIVGRAAKGLILSASRNRGKIAGSAIRRRYEKDHGKMNDKKAEMIVKNMVTIWGKCFGWGKIEFECGDEFRVIVKNSLEAVGFIKIKKRGNHPVCWMLLGYTWGLLEGIFARRFEGREVRCEAVGDERCEFVFQTVG